LEIKFPEYKYFVEFNSDQSIGFSNVLFSDKFKAGLIQVNWALDDNTYNEVLVQTLTFILNNNDQIIVTVAPSNSNNQGEVVISNYINQLLTWGLQDSKSKEYNYNPSQIYNIRNMQLISNIINYSEIQFLDDFIIAKLSIEIAILLLYSESYLNEYRYIVGGRNLRITENAYKIMRLCVDNEIESIAQRRNVAREIIKLLHIEKHVIITSENKKLEKKEL
jgi:hypothetical protein